MDRSFFSAFLGFLLTGCSTVTVVDGPLPGEAPLPPEPRPQPEPQAFCAATSFAAAPDEAVAAVWSNEALTLVRVDGSTVGIDPWQGEPAPADAQPLVQVVSGGDLVAVGASWARFPPGGPLEGATRVTWLERDGTVVRSLTAAHQVQLDSIGPDGTTAIYRYFGGSEAGHYAAVLPDGRAVEIDPSFTVLGPPLASGLLAGYSYDAADGYRMGWFDPSSGETLEASALSTGLTPWRFGDGFLTLSPGKSAPWLIQELLDGPVITPVWNLADHELEELGWHQARPEGWLMLQSANAELWRVRIEDGEALAAAQQLPAGWERLSDNCSLPYGSIASDGRVALPLREGGAAQLFAHDPATDGFTPIGETMGAPGTLVWQEQGGSYVITTGDGSDSFCPILWDEPAPAGSLPLLSVQVARPDDGVAHVLDDALVAPSPSATLLSADGTCLAYRNDSGWRLFDVLGGEAFSLAGDESGFRWIE